MKKTTKNFKIVLEYDGSSYHGWQRQKNTRTVQEEVETVLETITNQKITLIGSGRTDSGVHALGQVASFKASTKLVSENFHRGLNSLLPKDIVIRSCKTVSNNFHARFDAKAKVYRYHITNSCLPSAITRNFTWHIKKKINIEDFKLAATYFIGKHDFKSFEGTGSPRKNTVRNIIESSIQFDGFINIVYTIKADGFLNFMVRNIVGTLIEIGLGKHKPEHVMNLIKLKDRSKAGITAPPNGLFLINVDY